MFACRNCNLTERTVVIRQARDRFHHLPGTFDYVRCAGCGLVQLEQVPENLADYYGGYRVHTQDSRLYHLFRKLTIGHCYPLRPGPGALLDYGCGNGWFIKEMHQRGWQTYGYEPEAAYARSLATTIGLPVLSGEEAVRGHAGKLDLVSFSVPPPWMGRGGRARLFFMARAAQLPPPGFDEMSVEEKIDYVEALWDRIVANESQVPVPDWHREVLSERLAEYHAHPDDGRPWEAVEADLIKRSPRK